MIRVILMLLMAVSAVAQSPTHTLVFLHKRTDLPVMPKEEVDKLMQGHLANINRLAKEGKLVAAGPFDGGGGIFIFSTTSRADVESWLQTDPGIQAKRWNLEIVPYRAVIGSVCPVQEPYEMVSYTFIRFSPQLVKDNLPRATELFIAHQGFIAGLNKNGQVVTDAVIGELEDIVILKDDFSAKDFEVDKAVQESLLTVEVKKLYIAKGSFCEK